MPRRSNYEIVEDRPGFPMLIRDLGPWDLFLTITNDAEGVVEELAAAGKLPAGRRLFYIDSDGDRDEILHKDGQFLAFAPGPEPRMVRS